MGVDVPLPDGLPFNICVPTGFFENACVSADDLVFGDRRECVPCSKLFIGIPCYSYSTPPLVSTDFTLAEYEYGYFGDVDVTTDISAWIGIEMDLSAIWIGVGGECAKMNINPPNISPTDDIRDVMDEVANLADWGVRELADWGGPSRHSTEGKVLYVLILAIIAIIIVTPWPDPI